MNKSKELRKAFEQYDMAEECMDTASSMDDEAGFDEANAVRNEAFGKVAYYVLSDENMRKAVLKEAKRLDRRKSKR
ncbi:MAG: hypothetical protein LUC44_06040 [Prevotellaceae bacterium]|nr:hypothetical protein [Prevotellaceae bacterium]